MARGDAQRHVALAVAAALLLPMAAVSTPVGTAQDSAAVAAPAASRSAGDRSALADDAAAMIDIWLDNGRRYAEADGVERDLVKAARWYRKAAEKGNADAELALARVLWRLSRDPSPDLEAAVIDQYQDESLRWYRKAAGRGVVEAQYDLALRLGGEESMRWLRAAADGRDARAQYDLAVHLLEGRDVARDDAQAFRWVKRAADQDYPAPQYLLATLYDRGRGVTRDRVEALRWYRAAAEQGEIGARAALHAPAFRSATPCALDRAPRTWRQEVAPGAVLQLPADAVRLDPGDAPQSAQRWEAAGLAVRFDGNSTKQLVEAGLTVLGGDPVSIVFEGDAERGVISARWPDVGRSAQRCELSVSYQPPASRDVACAIVGAARLFDPLADLTLLRIDTSGPEPRALVRGERTERWVRKGDIVTRDYGRVEAISAREVEVIELHPNRDGGWIERWVGLVPSPGPDADPAKAEEPAGPDR